MSDKIEKAWRDLVAACGRGAEETVSESGVKQVKTTDMTDYYDVLFRESGEIVVADPDDISIRVRFALDDDIWIAWGRYREAVSKHILANMQGEVNKLVRNAFQKESVREALTRESKLLKAMREKGGPSDGGNN